MLLFYSPGACSLTEIIVLEWIGKPYRLCRVSREERQGETYRRVVNPHGVVPALEVGDRVLTENSALLLHLADANPEAGLVPPVATPERDDIHEWLAYLGSGFHVAHYPYFKPQRYLPDEADHPRLRETAVTEVRAQLEHVNGKLDGREFVHGDRRSILDPYLYAMARWSRRFLDDHAETYPNVAAFLERMERDDAVQFGLAVEKGEITAAGAGSGGFEGHVTLEDFAAGR